MLFVNCWGGKTESFSASIFLANKKKLTKNMVIMEYLINLIKKDYVKCKTEIILNIIK